jgi:hypothetical protein
MKFPLQAPAIQRWPCQKRSFPPIAWQGIDPALALCGGHNEITCEDQCCDARTKWCIDGACKDLPKDNMGNAKHPGDEFAIALGGRYFGIR